MNRGLELTLGDGVYVKLQLAMGYGQMSSSVYSRCRIDTVENFLPTEEYITINFVKEGSGINISVHICHGICQILVGN